MVDSENFEKTAIHTLVDILRRVPFLHVNRPMGPYKKEGELFPNDGIVKVEYALGSQTVYRWIVLEVKNNAQLRDVRNAIDQQINIDRIERFARNIGAPGYGVFASQYLSQSAKDYCRQKGVGYFDLSGNCYLQFDHVYIEKDVPLTVPPEKKRLRSIFSDKSARVIRRLLQYPDSDWRVQSLAGHANVSKATVSLLKDKLIDGGYAELNDDVSFRLVNPESLLLDWARHYSSQEHAQIECYGRGEVVENEAHFARFCWQNSVQYGFTMFSAARRVAPFTRGVMRSYAYVVSDKTLPELAEALQFKPVDSGGNFRLIRPTDSDLLYGSHDLDGEKLVSDIQLYLDLAGHKGRGEESAEFLLDQRIRKTWLNNTK